MSGYSILQLYEIIFVLSLVCLTLFVFVIFLVFHILRDKEDVSKAERISKLQEEVQSKNDQLTQLAKANSERMNYITSVFSTMNDGVLVMDSFKQCVLINPAMEQLIGVDNSVFFPDVPQKENLLFAEVKDLCVQCLQSKKNITKILQPSSEVFYEIQVLGIKSKYRTIDDLGVVAMIRDISVQHQIDTMRKEFVANVSHEFRTPITIISGFIETLQLWDGLESDDRTKALNIIEIETERLKRLVSELLTLSKIESNMATAPASYFNAIDVVKQLLTVVLPLANKKRIAIMQNIKAEAAMLYGNEDFFYQAVINLIDNAIKYTPEGGTVAIRASVKRGYLLIRVTDNGIGISKEDQKRIFERFYRVERSRGSKTGGSGIGLAIVKHITVLFEGKIEVESTLGQGSVFTLTVPLCTIDHE